MGDQLTIDEMATFCRKKGFVYANSDIYGGNSGFFDYGPLGVELFNNLKQHWWQFLIRRNDMVGIDGALISNPNVWKASGHVDHFGDLILTCTKCKQDFRADHFIEDALKVPGDGLSAKAVNALVQKHKLTCTKCKGPFTEVKDFNLMFQTSLGASKEKAETAYLRGELAQNIFMNFKIITETARMKLPFGIGSIGSVFRNEIAPRDFLFRCRQFHIAEFEYFIHPEQQECPLLTRELLKIPFTFLAAEAQQKDRHEEQATVSDLMAKGKCDAWQAYWITQQFAWFRALGISDTHLRLREHLKTELSHYSSGTFDIEYRFPFGTKEVAGNANRGQFDLTNHQNASGKSQEFFDEETKQKVIPRVIEPTWGMGRVFLMVLNEAYHDDQERGNIVLKLHPSLAPYAVGVFPLVNKLDEKASEIHHLLRMHLPAFYDRSGSIGRRYARADEIGIPYCITVDFDTLNDQAVTIRDRDSTKQKRAPIAKLADTIKRLINSETAFATL